MKLRPLVRVLLPVLSALLLWGCSAESKRAKLLERAGQHFKAKEFEMARIEYQNILQTDPNHVEANERLAQIWLDRGSPVRAAGYLSKVKEMAPGNVELRLKLAAIILSLGGASEARAEAMNAIERSTRFDSALVLLTEAVRSPEDLEQADQTLRKVSDKSTDSYLLAAANLASFRGNATEARTLLRRAVVQSPKSPEAKMALASFLMEHGAKEEAREQLKQAAELAPANSVIKVKYALLMAQLGQSSEAITYLHDMVKKVPDYLPPLRLLVQSAIAEKKFTEAESQLQQLFTKDPFDYEGHILRARLALAKGDVKQAIAGLEKLGQDYPAIGMEKHHLAMAYLHSGDSAAALASLKEAVGRNPDNLEAALQLVQLGLQLNDNETAQAVAAGVIMKRPNLLNVYPLLIEATRRTAQLEKTTALIGRSITVAPKNPQLYVFLGNTLALRGKPVEAQKSFEKALEVTPNYPAARVELVEHFLKERKLDSALEHAKALAESTPTVAAGHVTLGRVHAAGQKWKEAEVALRKAIELDPRHAGTYPILLAVYTAQKESPATAAEVEKLLLANSDNELLALVGAQFYLSLSQPEKARGVYERLIARKADSALALNNLAHVYLESLKQPELALETARKARAVDPKSPVVADTLGWILFLHGSHQEAAPLLQEAVRGLPQLSEVRYHQGALLHATGNKEGALKELRLALAGSNDFSGKADARKLLEQIESGR